MDDRPPSDDDSDSFDAAYDHRGRRLRGSSSDEEEEPNAGTPTVFANPAAPSAVISSAPTLHTVRRAASSISLLAEHLSSDGSYIDSLGPALAALSDSLHSTGDESNNIARAMAALDGVEQTCRSFVQSAVASSDERREALA